MTYFGTDVDPRDVPAYGIAEAAHYLRLNQATLRTWVVGRGYFAKGEQQYWKPVIELPDPKLRALSFMNLIEAHVLSSIRRQHKVSFPAVRSALHYVREHHRSKHPLADREFETDGKDLFIEELGRTINASSKGQQVLREIMGRFLKRIERDTMGLAVRLFPYTRPSESEDTRLVVIDALVSFGRPVVAGTGIRTSVILDRFLAGDAPEQLAEDYGRSRAEIDEAIRWEKLQNAA